MSEETLLNDSIIGNEKWGKNTFIKKHIEKVQEYSQQVIQLIDNLKSLADTDLESLDMTKLAYEADKNINKLQKWITFKTEHMIKIRKYETAFDKVVCGITVYYEHNSDLKMATAESRRKVIEAHPCYLAYNDLIKKYQILIKYIEGTIDTLKARNFTIKNIIDLKKLELNEI